MSKIKIELTKEFNGMKKGEVIERSKDIAMLHINSLKNAKLYVKQVKKSKKVE